ncbi:DUF3368 domain-containing protein [Treponema denticola]|uniref:Nucleic acid-binding protein n=1 Tax=Treponema denticola SP33 TaxID=999437 RepID=M2BVM7_TREDN|nr:DUF3368 domain-containing protein [Treponema denticola]EMB25543.1 hypothetical protein HMPREF9733_00675 [Treponema denticola SP33]EPF37197.1 hypothetical protein HMPREF9732_01226 [Treponema denticola SP32]
MIVISDTTPVISFLKIDRLDLLETLFGIVQIPRSVFAELTGNIKYRDEAEIIKNTTFIQMIDDIDENYVSLLRRSAGLDLGESEAIYLSDNKKADLLLMDEARGREVAIRMGIKVMGTIGILGLAYEDSLISKEEIKQAIEILRDFGRHISERLYEQLLNFIQRN